MSNYNEIRSKWEKIIAALPYGQPFEFDISDAEAEIVVDIMNETCDTLYRVEKLNPKRSYVN